MEKTKKKKGDVELRKSFADGFLKWALLLLIISSLCGRFIFQTEMGFVNNSGFDTTASVCAIATVLLCVMAAFKKGGDTSKIASVFELPLVIFGLFLLGFVLFGFGHVHGSSNGILGKFTHEVIQAGPPAVGGALAWCIVCVLAILGNFFRAKSGKGVLGFFLGFFVAMIVEALLFQLVFFGELHMKMINGDQSMYHEMTMIMNDWICAISGGLLAVVCAYDATKSLKKQEKIESKTEE